MADELKGHKELVKVFGFLVIVGLGWILPAPAPITPIGVRVFFVFLAVVYGWSVTGQVWPSLLSCLMFPLTGVVTMKEFIAMGWGGDVFYFMVLAFVLIKFLEQVGVSQFLAAWLMSRKFIQGHPWRLIFMILLTAYVICSLVNIFIGIFLVWEIVYNITKIVKQKPLDKFPTLMVFGVAMMGALSLSAMPWGSNAIVNLGVYANIMGEPGNMIRYIIYTIPVGILSMFAYLVLCKYVFRLDIAPLKEISGEMINPQELVLTKTKKIAFLALSVFIALLLLPSLLPKTTALYQVLNNMGVVGVIVLVFTALSLVKVDGENIFDFAALARAGIPWNMLAMTLIILAIGGCLMNPATGINAYLQQNLTPLFTSLSPFVFVIAITLITFILTNFMINMVVVALLLPAVVNMSSVLGINPEQISYLIMVVSTNAILTPVASAASVILFPNTEWIRSKDIYKYGVITAIVITVIAFLVNYFFMGFFY
ncbi:SLC13 family permease [Desulfosporosinus shakirovi]|uniref:SLC13 family permease n=1 Tax=Desulfosporosinus shakirovi TaxID=2885154 RepID=UPI001E4735EA|nr:SLC13 family permease [Desulfosporosinus sp. SRJS8]MCB8815254.1 SLC13 family permease [Desulfosporosinus sp. SRJS8]